MANEQQTSSETTHKDPTTIKVRRDYTNFIKKITGQPMLLYKTYIKGKESHHYSTIKTTLKYGHYDAFGKQWKIVEEEEAEELHPGGKTGMETWREASASFS